MPATNGFKAAVTDQVHSSHASAVYAEWKALNELQSDVDTEFALNGNDLTIAEVVAVSLYGIKASLTNDGQVLQKVTGSVDFLAQELDAGRIVYGVNTGFGGSADTRTQQLERLQSGLVQHLNVGILLQSDKGQKRHGRRPDTGLLRSHAMPTPIIKAAMLIRCNSLLRGHSGVRITTIQSIMDLLHHDLTPVVPLRGSISASGDLSPLSYIAGAIEGNPDVYLKTGNDLALLIQLLTAMGTEALAGTAHNYHPFISAARPHPGQAEAASNILAFLSGSQLSSDCDSSPEKIGLAQDRYALRTAPQWIGPQLEDLQLATSQVEVELNSTTDNPLVDVQGGRIHHGGNFQAMALTSAMEKTLLVLQNLGRLLYAQAAELANGTMNKGLPHNLSAQSPSESFTAKGFDVNMAAYMAELGYLAHPVSGHVQVAEIGNQGVNSMALVAGRYALEAGEVVGLMCATYVWLLCQGLDLRAVVVEFEQEGGEGVKGVLEAVFGERDGMAENVAEVVMRRWGELGHLDVQERARTAAGESVGAVLGLLEGREDVTVAKVREYQTGAEEALARCYIEVRKRYLYPDGGIPPTAKFLSPASRLVYRFVREELGIPMNRGVEDHPTLRLGERVKRNGAVANGNGVGNSNGNGVNGHAEGAEAPKGRDLILGSSAGLIYEEIRNGELHARIMKFGQETGMWG
ncbi:L-Aspartase-like protein [Bombardia bombarda]|uniref:L-Aspartase-like protein n=1 Tax=Bombardia bombarda TaxID=252184 RepID=A0AA39U3B8_9PEZI|nr:L-Aspartase-like protein [Bombardia bombarda]